MKRVYSLFSDKSSQKLLNTRVSSSDADSVDRSNSPHSMSDSSSVVSRVMSFLPADPSAVKEKFLLLKETFIFNLAQESITHPTLHDAALPGIDLFASVLKELDKVKSQLGGTPVFGTRNPTIDLKELNVFMFGVPMSAVKDWVSKALKNKWKPTVFWAKLGKQFGIRADLQMSQYEEAHIRIQRFGLLIANKERFLKILDNKDADRYDELGRITGMAWHPEKNSAAVEKEFIEFIEQFLTIYFVSAQQKGTPEAMMEYFNAFYGVCLEDRARNLVDYAQKNPITGFSYAAVADWDTGGTAEDAFMKEATALAAQLRGDDPDAAITPEKLLSRLINGGVFDLEFTTISGEKSKPSKESFYKWAKEQVDACILDDFESPIPSFLPDKRQPPPVPSKKFIATKKDKPQAPPVPLKKVPAPQKAIVEKPQQMSELQKKFAELQRKRDDNDNPPHRGGQHGG